MTYEATLLFETHIPIPFTVADGATIEKGTLLALSDPMTAAAHASDEQVFAGILRSEKVANDGCITADVYRGGIFKVTASGAIAVGETCALSSLANKVKKADATCSGSKTIGVALETVADGETFRMEVRPACNTSAYA